MSGRAGRHSGFTARREGARAVHRINPAFHFDCSWRLHTGIDLGGTSQQAAFARFHAAATSISYSFDSWHVHGNLMNSFRRRFLMQMFVLFDTLVLALSLYFAFLGRQASAPISMLLALKIRVPIILVVAGLLYGWHILFSRMGLYQSRRVGSQVQEVKDLLKAAGLATLLLIAAGLLFRLPSVTPVLVIRFLLISAS